VVKDEVDPGRRERRGRGRGSWRRGGAGGARSGGRRRRASLETESAAAEGDQEREKDGAIRIYDHGTLGLGLSGRRPSPAASGVGGANVGSRPFVASIDAWNGSPPTIVIFRRARLRPSPRRDLHGVARVRVLPISGRLLSRQRVDGRRADPPRSEIARRRRGPLRSAGLRDQPRDRRALVTRRDVPIDPIDERRFATDVDLDGAIRLAARMKELRYAKKVRWLGDADLARIVGRGLPGHRPGAELRAWTRRVDRARHPHLRPGDGRRADGDRRGRGASVSEEIETIAEIYRPMTASDAAQGAQSNAHRGEMKCTCGQSESRRARIARACRAP